MAVGLHGRYSASVRPRPWRPIRMRLMTNDGKGSRSMKPIGIVLLAASALLFLTGSGLLTRVGAMGYAHVGIVGAAVAVAVVLLFLNWNRH